MRIALCICLGQFLAATALMAAQPGGSIAFSDEYDSATPTWDLDSPAAVGQIARRERLLNPAATEGASLERLAVLCPPGSSVRIAQTIPAAPVIDESRVVIRVRTNRPGLQLAARVILPRTASGSEPPQSVVVRGTRDDAPGGWHELEIRELPLLVTRQARVLRTSSETPVDERGAYLDRVILIVPGGAGVSEVLIDKLVVQGIVSTNAPTGAAEGIRGPQFPTPDSPNQLKPAPIHDVRVSGVQISVDHRPFFPRVVQHHGEDFEFLARCGFNVVWLRDSPTVEELHAAKKLGMAIIAPPPREPIRAEEASDWNAMLAWDLGTGVAVTQLDAVAAQAQTLRREDQVLQRPLIAAPSDSLERFSRVADILLIGRRSSLHDLRLVNWRRELESAQQSARPGTPMWVRLHLDASQQLVRQVRVLAPHAANAWQTPHQIARQAQLAIGSGAKGLVFASHQSLASSDSSNKRMLAACELLNRELKLIEPWLMAGTTTGFATCTDSTREAVVMQRERVRLVAIRRMHNSISATDSSRHTLPPAIIVPGVSESAGAYVLTPGGLKALSQSRVSGGVRIPLEEVPAGAYIVLTDDAAAVTALTRGVNPGGPRAAQIARFLSVEELRQAEQIGAQLGQMPEAQRAAQQATTAAKAAIGQADILMASRDHEAAYRQLLIARDHLASLDNNLLAQPALGTALASSPLDGSLLRMIDQWKLKWALSSLPIGDNLLFAGDCEELSLMQQSGWTHTRYPVPEIESAVELTSDSPQQGARSLRLIAKPAANSTSNPPADSAAVWIASPEVPLTSGQTVEIAGWAWVPASNQCRLTITDSLGGEELALNVDPAPNWQAFRMIRTAAEANSVQIEFALYGCGEARIDGVMVRPVLPAPTARRLPAAEKARLQIAK